MATHVTLQCLARVGGGDPSLYPKFTMACSEPCGAKVLGPYVALAEEVGSDSLITHGPQGHALAAGVLDTMCPRCAVAWDAAFEQKLIPPNPWEV